MEYYKKYIKYKNKYLLSKQQTGGLKFSITEGTNTVKVNKIPITISDKVSDLLSFLQEKIGEDVISLYIPETCHASNDCIYINFRNNKSANDNLEYLKKALDNFIKITQSSSSLPESYSSRVAPIVRIEPVLSLATLASLPLVSSDPLPNTKFFEAWNTKNSNSLYMALVISPKTQVGDEIKKRLNNLGFNEIYNKYIDSKYSPSDFLLDPHLSLFSLSIPQGGTIDKYLSDNRQLNLFGANIKSYFDRYISIPKKQLYSELGNYEQLGAWIARQYIDNKLGANILNKTEFNNFLKDIVKYLFGRNRIDPRIIIENKSINPARNPQIPKSKKPTFTHYGIEDTIENSLLAVSSFTTDFFPHISIIKEDKLKSNSYDVRTFINAFKTATGDKVQPISYLNLWSDHDSNGKFLGNISHIYISYNRNHIYIPL